MIVFLESLLRWWLRVTLPFTHWRVPVRVLRGASLASGREVRLLSAGQPRWSAYVSQHLFAGEPVVEKSVLVPVWSLQKQLDQWQSAADLTLVGINRISARLFLGRRYLAVPSLVSSWISVPEDLSAYRVENSNRASDFRRVRKKEFVSHLSTTAGDLDLFYDHYFQPYIQGRHTRNARMTPRWMLRLVFRFGAIQWLTLNGERVAADLVMKQGRDYHLVVTGLRDGRLDLLRQGAMAALYVHALDHARQLGCTRIILGGSRPSLHDGVLRYKGKWLDAISWDASHVNANHILLLRWNRLPGAVAEFLSGTGLIHHDQSGYSALWAYPGHLPLTAENLQQQYQALKLKGLRRFRILLPGKAPPGFICPPEVRLIELEDAEKAGPAGINSLG